jgi:hypothetical protein
MGYISQAGLCLDDKGRQQLEARITDLQGISDKSAHKAITGFLASADLKRDHESGAVVYCWDCVKWYDDFPEISQLESFMESLEDEDYLFIRIGESEDDMEKNGEFWDNPFGMSLVRKIGFD